MTNTRLSGLKSRRRGRRGERQVEAACEDELDWWFWRDPPEDHGFDGIIEMRDDRLEFTGKYLAVQVKSSIDLARTGDGNHWKAPVEHSHIDYWKRHSMPVLMVVWQESDDTLFWVEVNHSSVGGRRNKSPHVLVPVENRFDASAKKALTALGEASPEDLRRRRLGLNDWLVKAMKEARTLHCEVRGLTSGDATTVSFMERWDRPAIATWSVSIGERSPVDWLSEQLPETTVHVDARRCDPHDRERYTAKYGRWDSESDSYYLDDDAPTFDEWLDKQSLDRPGLTTSIEKVWWLTVSSADGSEEDSDEEMTFFERMWDRSDEVDWEPRDATFFQSESLDDPYRPDICVVRACFEDGDWDDTIWNGEGWDDLHDRAVIAEAMFEYLERGPTPVEVAAAFARDHVSLFEDSAGIWSISTDAVTQWLDQFESEASLV